MRFQRDYAAKVLGNIMRKLSPFQFFALSYVRTRKSLGLPYMLIASGLWAQRLEQQYLSIIIIIIIPLSFFRKIIFYFQQHKFSICRL